MKISLVSRPVPALVAFAVLSFGQTAAAQPAPATKPAAAPAPSRIVTSTYTEERVEGGAVVTFPGDDLPGDPYDPYGGIVRAPPRVLRLALIRPRMNFVPELLKSVENL